jgi:uncharacterized membrane protein YuzA (DUF378 family)
MSKLRNRIGAIVGLAALMCVVVAQSAFAAANSDAVTAVTGATGTLEDTITAAMPLILGVAVVLVVLSLAKRLVKKAG